LSGALESAHRQFHRRRSPFPTFHPLPDVLISRTKNKWVLMICGRVSFANIVLTAFTGTRVFFFEGVRLLNRAEDFNSDCLLFPIREDLNLKNFVGKSLTEFYILGNFASDYVKFT